MREAIRVERLFKVYHALDWAKVEALRGISFAVNRGQDMGP